MFTWNALLFSLRFPEIGALLPCSASSALGTTHLLAILVKWIPLHGVVNNSIVSSATTLRHISTHKTIHTSRAQLPVSGFRFCGKQKLIKIGSVPSIHPSVTCTFLGNDYTYWHNAVNVIVLRTCKKGCDIFFIEYSYRDFGNRRKRGSGHSFKKSIKSKYLEKKINTMSRCNVFVSRYSLFRYLLK